MEANLAAALSGVFSGAGGESGREGTAGGDGEIGAAAERFESSYDVDQGAGAAGAEAGGAGLVGGEEGGMWPDATAESQFLADQRAQGVAVVPISAAVAAEIADEAAPKSLPPLNELVQRLPQEVRDILDELFRARFTTVRRVQAKSLKEIVAKS